MANKLASDDMRSYEIMYIVAGDQTDAFVAEVTTRVKEEITSRGGTITQEDFWGLRELAYPIKRRSEGFYTVLNFELPANKVTELNKDLRLDTTLLRFLITALPKGYVFRTYDELFAETGTESDRISEEGRTIQKKPRVAAAATPAASAAPKPEPAEKPAPEKPAESKPETPAEKETTEAEKKPAETEEERLKKLDEQIDKLMHDDEL